MLVCDTRTLQTLNSSSCRGYDVSQMLARRKYEHAVAVDAQRPEQCDLLTMVASMRIRCAQIEITTIALREHRPCAHVKRMYVARLVPARKPPFSARP
jgi:hypothetical protein